MHILMSRAFIYVLIHNFLWRVKEKIGSDHLKNILNIIFSNPIKEENY